MDSIFVLVILALLAIGGLLARVLASRRSDVWHRFAAKHRLRFRYDPAPFVDGSIAGRQVELRTEQRGSDAELGLGPFRLSVGLNHPAANRLRILQTIPAARLVHELAENDVVKTGDDVFDARFTVHTPRSDTATAFLNASRRAALIRLVEQERLGIVELNDAKLSVDATTLYAEERDLETTLNALLTCADTLDGRQSSRVTIGSRTRA